MKITDVRTVLLTGIDAALWDLKGKMLGVPVYELLGGLKHDKLLGYATGGPSNYPRNRLATKIDYYRSLGFAGLKLGVGAYSPETGWTLASEPAQAADFEASKLEFVRSHAGSDLRVMLDAHMDNSREIIWDLQTSLAVAKAVAPYDLVF